jgi:hypothetical protein
MGDKGVGHPLTPPNSFSRTGEKAVRGGAYLDTVLHSGKVATMLSPFDFLLIYTTEVAQLETNYSDGAHMEVTGAAFGGNPGATARVDSQRYRSATACLLLQGVELFDQGMVTSVNDVVSEMTFNFVCKDIKDFAAFSPVVPDQIARELAEAARYTSSDSSIEDSAKQQEAVLADYLQKEADNTADVRSDAQVLSEGGTQVSIESIEEPRGLNLPDPMKHWL